MRVRTKCLLLMAVLTAPLGCRDVDVSLGTRLVGDAAGAAGDGPAGGPDAGVPDGLLGMGGAGGLPGSGPPDGGSPGLASCPTAPSQPPPFFAEPYIDIGNVLVDRTDLYVKVSDCCVNPPGYTLRLPRAGGQAQLVHHSARYHTGLAQDEARVYITTQEGLKYYDKAARTLVVVPNRVYEAVAVFQGRAYALDARRLESVDEASMARVLLDGSYVLTDLQVDAAGIYLRNGNAAGELLVVPLGGGDARALVPGTGSGGDLAADQQFLYWARDTAIFRTAKLDGQTDKLAHASSAVAGLAVDATHVYFTARGIPCARALAGTGTMGGVVARIAKTGGAVTELATNQIAPSKITVDDTEVFWVAGSNQNHYRSMYRLPK